MPLLETRDLVKLFPVHRGWLGRARNDRSAWCTRSTASRSRSARRARGRRRVRFRQDHARPPRARADRADLGPDPLRGRGRHAPVDRAERTAAPAGPGRLQDPYSSLDPRQRARDIIREPLDIHGVGTPAERRRRVSELLEQIHLRAVRKSFPHELSGGQRQRVSIATALALGPKLIVADEPVSALDVSVQAQILDLLAELQRNTGIAYILISHDLGVVEQVSDRVAVVPREDPRDRVRRAGLRRPSAAALHEGSPLRDPDCRPHGRGRAHPPERRRPDADRRSVRLSLPLALLARRGRLPGRRPPAPRIRQEPPCRMPRHRRRARYGRARRQRRKERISHG